MMARNPHGTQTPLIEAEQKLLRAVCSRRTSSERIIAAIDALANYAWLVPEHATVFQAIRRSLALDRNSWRELLPAQTTRMGFPDVAWPEYFAAGDRDETASLNDLIKRLIH
jgi:hypothetical protein